MFIFEEQLSLGRLIKCRIWHDNKGAGHKGWRGRMCTNFPCEVELEEKCLHHSSGRQHFHA